MRIKLLLVILCGFLGTLGFAQTTITTSHTNNNGNGSVTFNVQNTNAYDIIITGVNCHLGTSATNNLQLLYNTTPVNDNAAPWSFGTVGAGQNGWVTAGTATVSSNTANGIVTAISGLSLTIPAGATYGLGFSGTTIQYMTLTNGAGVNTFSAGGVNLLTGDGISWGGTAYPSTPANYPRGFIGGITFIPAVPCTAPPTAGTVSAATNPICPSVNNTLSITGGTGGTGQTYQWQSSTTGAVGSFTDIGGATMSTYVSNQTVDTYYRFYTVCGGMADTSAAFLVNTNSFLNCYCTSNATSTADEDILNVTVGTVLNNTSTCTSTGGPGSIQNQYSNYSNLPPADLILGASYPLSVQIGTCGGNYNNTTRVYVDFNQNGQFTDPGETIITPAFANGPNTQTGTLTVPLTAAVGQTRMRVVNVETTGAVNPCGTYTWGETEDYIVNVLCPTLTVPTAVDAGVCSGNSVTLNASTTFAGTTISWWDAATGGTQVGSGTSYTTPVLVANTAYYPQQDYAGCPSGPRDTVSVTVSSVDVTLAPIDASCNGGDNGSFTQTAVNCGTAPYLYSVGSPTGPFGPIPTNLTAGTYFVYVQDATLATSVGYQVIVGEPAAPSALNATNITYFNATLDWTTTGDETSWTVIYGPTGFDPATAGTVVTGATNPYDLTGVLSANTTYDFYVFSECGPLPDTAGPQTFTTDPGFFTWDTQCGPGFTDISATGTALNLADDATTGITTVNALSVQGIASNNITVSNNGWISWGGITLNAWNLDLDAEEGNVYWEEMNIAGDDYLIVQWDDRPRFPGIIGQNVTFQILFNQTSGEFYYVYDDVVFGGSQASNDYGQQGTISVVAPTSVTVSSNNNTFLTNNSCAHFYYALCPNVTNFTSLVYPDDALLDWDAGLYGETEWTLIYGLAGFDPTVSGQEIGTFTLSSSDASFGTSLTQLTCYDVYIYSECQADNLTSDGFFYSFCTLPFCSNPSGLAGTTYVDSLDLSWNFTETPGYPVTSFNIQYGMNGLTPTEVVANGIDFTDTIMDASLLAGGVYEVYVQAACSASNDTSDWVGPITLVMPLTNDTVCGAETLALATNYTFNNTGATVSLDEVNVAPPATGAQSTTGWANSTLNNTTWFTFVAPASGSVRINNTATNYNGQLAVYDVTDCGDFNSNFLLVNANDDEIDGTSLAPNFTVCGLTPGSTYYIMHDGFNGTTGNYSISISEIVLEAGLAQPLTQICTGDVIDLFTTINGNDNGGMWSAPVAAANASISGSMFNSNGLGYQTFDFQYRMTDGCAYDSIVSQVQIFGLSSAGTDGVLTVCKNEPVDLLSGLGGTIDLGGTWYDPSNNSMASSMIDASAFPGSFNYDYITGNGVCPDDTSNVVVTVLATCDYLSIQEEVFEGVQVYPNPTTGILNIDADKAFEVKVTDANGRTIRTSSAISAGTSTIDLSKVQIGVYFVELSNENATKVFRIVVQ